MPPKKTGDATPTQRVLTLYNLLLFSGKRYGLTQLAKLLKCSKQTIFRHIEDIEASQPGSIETGLEGRSRWYRMKAPQARPKASLTAEEIRHLTLCRDMVRRFLPEGFREEVDNSLRKTTVLLQEMEERARALTSFCSPMLKGHIDYTPFQEVIERLLTAIEKREICVVSYASPSSLEEREHHFAPSQLVSYREALYVCGQKMNEKGAPEPLKSMVLAIHRIRGIAPTRRTFNLPPAEGQEPILFGFERDQPFRVRARFSGQAARYVQERVWSEDQKLLDEEGGASLTFTARSRPEVVSWILSFGRYAELLEPDDLRQAIQTELTRMTEAYFSSRS